MSETGKRTFKVSKHMGAVFEMVAHERMLQDQKWGIQNHPPEKWVGILGEEYGEYCQAVNETIFDNGAEAKKKGGRENMIGELVQVAAVAFAAIECLIREAVAEAEGGGNEAD